MMQTIVLGLLTDAGLYSAHRGNYNNHFRNPNDLWSIILLARLRNDFQQFLYNLIRIHPFGVGGKIREHPVPQDGTRRVADIVRRHQQAAILAVRTLLVLLRVSTIN